MIRAIAAGALAAMAVLLAANAAGMPKRQPSDQQQQGNGSQGYQQIASNVAPKSRHPSGLFLPFPLWSAHREGPLGSMDEVPRLSPEMASRKLQALAFIELYFARHRTGPSLGEIAGALGTDRTRAHGLVRQLEREARIRRTPGQARSIRPVSAEEEAVRLARLAGYLVTDPQLLPPPDLDHDPGSDGQAEIEEQGGERRRDPAGGGA